MPIFRHPERKVKHPKSFFYLPGPSKGCQENPNKGVTDTLLHETNLALKMEGPGWNDDHF